MKNPILNEIKNLVADRDITLTKLAEKMGERLGRKYSLASLSQKLRNGTISYREIMLIAEILDYKIIFYDLNEKKFKVNSWEVNQNLSIVIFAKLLIGKDSESSSEWHIPAMLTRRPTQNPFCLALNGTAQACNANSTFALTRFRLSHTLVPLLGSKKKASAKEASLESVTIPRVKD